MTELVKDVVHEREVSWVCNVTSSFVAKAPYSYLTFAYFKDLEICDKIKATIR